MLDQDTTVPVEEWRPVVGREETYSVSNLGRVRRDVGGRGAVAGRVLGMSKDPKGYMRVGISGGRRGSLKVVFVHHLVAEAFIGRRPKGHGINHISGVKDDNRPGNLEWATSKQNSEHAVANGLTPTGDRHGWAKHPEAMCSGEQHKNAKLTDAAVRDILTSPLRNIELAEKYGVSSVGISRVRSRQIWRHINVD